jgi:hypothetical protein
LFKKIKFSSFFSRFDLATLALVKVEESLLISRFVNVLQVAVHRRLSFAFCMVFSRNVFKIVDVKRDEKFHCRLCELHHPGVEPAYRTNFSVKKTTLETSGEDVKTTLGTSIKDKLHSNRE